MPMNREELLVELRRLNGAAAKTEHDWQLAVDVLTRAAQEYREAPHGERNEAAARFDAATVAARSAEQAHSLALSRVWVIARRVAG